MSAPASTACLCGCGLAVAECMAFPGFEPIIAASAAQYGLQPAYALTGAQGAGFVGRTGTGKTRLAYALLRRAAVAGLKPYAVTASRFRQAAADKHSDDLATRAKARETITAARHAQALLLDDIGKGSSTPAGDEALYELLNHRRDDRRVTFWTANGGSDWLRSKLGPDYGPAIIRRMLDLTGWHDGNGNLFTEKQP